ncbi:MAG: hypothetical protein LUE22_09220 [Oscillospiraceae bacterium]|nr:hypothetical protein [Oscillospiraceae bacterium]
MNSKKKPKFDPDAILQSLMEAAVSTYSEKKSLWYVANELNLNQVKARKLLITAKTRGFICSYESPIADEILYLWKQGKSASEIMEMTGLSRASVNSYLPYVRPPYRAAEVSVNADRAKRYRERKAACERLSTEPGGENLWSAIILFEGYPFYTAKNLKFRYEVRGGEMFVDRKEKSITKSSVEMAYRKAVEMDGKVSGPKKLGVFGASYLYPVLVRLGVIRTEAS